MAADGQVTLGDHVLKHSAKKIRRLYQDKILAGFAGSTADAFSLFARFESKLEQYAGNLNRAAVELAKDWRTDKMLRNLEALLVVADAGPDLPDLRFRRRDRSRRTDRRHRLRRQLRHRRRARADGEHRPRRPRDCRKSHEDRRRHLHLYQRPASPLRS